MKDLKDVKLYENRELSWISFNQRVLEEAKNLENPLLERAKFLSIVSSNLDEFFMVRIASLKEQVNASYDKADFAGLTPKEQLRAISQRTHTMVEEQANNYRRSLVPAMKKEGLHLLEVKEMTKEQHAFTKEYFSDVVYPVLTPMAVDSSRPFPLILNKSLNIAVLIRRDDHSEFATVQVPSVLGRYTPIPNMDDGSRAFVLLENIIMDNIERLFVGCNVMSSSPYRLTRNGDLSIDEEEASDLLVEIEKSIKKRKWGVGIRLEVEKSIESKLYKKLYKALDVHQEDVYYINGPLDLTFLMKLCFLPGFDYLRFPKFTPALPKGLLGVEDIFDAISKKDIFLSHPFESFDPVVELITKAAKDQKVLAIKQTLYRVSGDSPIVKELALAAESGKQVTVLVELKARFDEENNIAWARRLEQSGCHVIYGLVGLKTHSKVTLIVRKEAGGIKRYVHLGTGNYNDSTAKLYTDLGLFTCNELIGADVSAIFNTISGYSDPPKLNRLAMAPTGMRERFNQLIRREAKYAEEGKEAQIIAKMNSLCDQEIIEELYKASRAGVKIELIVRGICSLIPGIEDVSENITVRSIIGKYLEHSRVYCFGNNGDMEVYLSSADLMPRNLNRRVELLFPIESDEIKEQVMMLMHIQMKDVVKGKIKDNTCHYNKIDRRGKAIINSQEFCERMAHDHEMNFVEEIEREPFRPVMSEMEARKLSGEFVEE